MSKELNSQDQFKPIRIIRIEKAEPFSDDPTATAERLLKKPVVVNVFTDGPDTSFDPQKLQEYLGKTFGSNFTVANHGDLINYVLSGNPEKKKEIIENLARANLSKQGAWTIPLEERMKLEGETVDRDPAIPFREHAREQARRQRFGISTNDYYNISDLGDAYSSIIPQELKTPEEDKRKSFLIITGRGVGEKMGAYGEGVHMRAGFTHGNLAVVSTTGMIDAPGKPWDVEQSLRWGFISTNDEGKNKEFREELEKRGNAINGSILEEILNKVYEDKMLHFEDPRINEAVKGITLSMILFTLGEHGRAGSCSTSDLSKGEPDTSKFCRLHDAHWQEELIATQIKDKGQPEFCDYHKEIFTKLNSVR